VIIEGSSRDYSPYDWCPSALSASLARLLNYLSGHGAVYRRAGLLGETVVLPASTNQQTK
jgi:hypothetical protein